MDEREQQRQRRREHLVDLIASARVGDETITDEQLFQAYHDTFEGVVSNAEHIARISLMAGAPLCVARPRLTERIMQGVLWALLGDGRVSSPENVEDWAEEVAERIAAVNRDLYGDQFPEESCRWVRAMVTDGSLRRMAERESELERQDFELHEALGLGYDRTAWLFHDHWDALLLAPPTLAIIALFMDEDLERSRAALAGVVESLNRHDPGGRIPLYGAQWSGKSPPTPMDVDRQEDWLEGELPRIYWIFQGQIVARAVLGAGDDAREIDRHTRALAERLEG